ncbi:hypothetical protein JCM17823_14580 [Halorubrum gandharaense]
MLRLTHRNHQLYRIAFATAVAATAVALAVSPPSVGATDDPELTVTYTEFEEDSALVLDALNGEKVTVGKSATAVAVEQDEVFVRLEVTNTNTYPTEVTVHLASEIVDPATLGEVRALDEDVVAEWNAERHWDDEGSSDPYTEVTVVVPAETSLQLAPSQVRVKSLAWTADAERGVETIRDRVDVWTDEHLAQRHYALDGERGNQITIDLVDPETGEPVDEWQATYTTDADDGTHPLTRQSNRDVFFTEIRDGEAVRIVFNTDAEVEFVAEPTVRESAEHELASYTSSVREVLASPFTEVIAR